MQVSLSGILFALGVASISVAGCSGGDAAKVPVKVKKDVAYVRFLNLTSESANGSMAGVVVQNGIESNGMSIGVITPLSEQTYALAAGEASAEVKLKPTPGAYLTVVGKMEGKKLALKTVTGGACKNPESGSRVEVANFTTKTIECTLDSKPYSLKPSSSEVLDCPAGSYTVTSKGTDDQSVAPTEKEIWLVYFIEVNGKVTSKSVKVKGAMTPTVAGGSRAG